MRTIRPGLVVASLMLSIGASSAANDPGSRLATPEAVAARYSIALAKHDIAALTESCHPTAMSYELDSERVIGRSHYGRKAQMRASPATDSKWVVSRIDQLGDAAVAVLTTEGAFSRTEYVLMLRLANGWRCVGSVQTRAMPTTKTAETFEQAAKALVERKHQSDLGWDAALLLASQHARSMIYNVDDGELVSASADEWAARYAERRRKPVTTTPTQYVVESLHGALEGGYVRWTITWSDGSKWTDFALLIQDAGQWSMLNLAFVPTPKQ
jgi:hypothetical protein